MTVAVLGDAIDEANETFNVDLTNPANATLADAQGVGTITDDDPAPTIAIDDVSVVEGNAGSVNAVFTVSLSAPSGKTITVVYATADGSATAGADYTTTSGTLTFAAGATTQKVTVAVLGDAIYELDEDFTVHLTSPVNATLADADGRGTIANDDIASLVVTNTSDTGLGSLRQAILTANLTAGEPHTISFAIPGAGLQTIVPTSPLPKPTDPISFDIPSGSSVQVGVGAGFTMGDFSQLDKVGGGKLILGGAQSHANAALLRSLSGELELASDGGTLLTVRSEAMVVFSAPQDLAALVITSGKSAVVATGGGNTLAVASLVVDAGGALDLADNGLVIRATLGNRDATLATIASLLASGFNAGDWSGLGIRSSAAANDASHLTALGYLLNDNGGAPLFNLFGGATVDANAVLVKRTYYGDGNLDGVVDGTDYTLIDNGYNFSLSGWRDGDFNYSGDVDGTDYAMIDNAFHFQSGPLTAGAVNAVPAPAIAARPISVEAISSDPLANSASDEPIDGLAIVVFNRSAAPPSLERAVLPSFVDSVASSDEFVVRVDPLTRLRSSAITSGIDPASLDRLAEFEFGSLQSSDCLQENADLDDDLFAELAQGDSS